MDSAYNTSAAKVDTIYSVIKKVFEKYCLRSPANGVQMEWMHNISLLDAEDIILKEYKEWNYED